jgi:hypothetical protein
MITTATATAATTTTTTDAARTLDRPVSGDRTRARQSRR